MPLVILGPLDTAAELAPDGLGLALQFGVTLTVSCLHLVSSSLLFRYNCSAWCLGVVGVRGPISQLFTGPSLSSTKEIAVGWGSLAGLPWIKYLLFMLEQCPASPTS